MEKLSWIYFYNQRRVNRAEVCDQEMVGYLISNIQNWLKDDLRKMRETDLLTQEAMGLSNILTDEDLAEFGLLESIDSYYN